MREYIRTGVTAMTDRLIIDSGGIKKGTDSAALQEDQQRSLQDGQNDAVIADSGVDTGTSTKINTLEPEIVWGNDRAFMKLIDEGLRADLRLFVRIRYIQKVTCTMVYEDIEKEPCELDEPLQLMIVDISVGGIGVICEQEIEVGMILGITIILDNIPYDVKYEVVYCIPMDDKFRIGLKIAQRDKVFMRHLKIFVARISLTSAYASGE
jgi:hypothetical protein